MGLFLLGSLSSIAFADDASYQTGADTGVSKLPALVSKVDSVTDQTIKGVDLTSYQAEIAAGVKFYDFNHVLLDGNGLMQLLKNNGINYVNLKIAVNPFDTNNNTYGQGQPTLDNAIKTAQLAKNAGLKVNFTLLFSDAYTSDDVQKAPKNWPSDNEKLHSQVTAYIDDVISQFNNNKVLPNMITVGNQINYKFIDKTDWPTITMLLKSVTDDIHEKLPTTLIGIGLGKPNSYWSTPIWQLNNAGIHYDEVVANINPAWNSMDDIAAAKKVVLSAGKKFTVGSVTYPFTDQDSDGKQNDSLASDILSKNIGTISPQGQATYLQNLFKTVTSENNNTDAGVFYGDATWVAVKPGSTTNYQFNKDAANKFGTGWASQYGAGYIEGAEQYWGGNTQDNQALFDDLGKPLQTLTIFKQISDADNSNTTPTDDPNAAQKDPYEFGGDTGLKDQKVVINKIPSMTHQSIRGVDVSSYQSLKDAGVKFYDYNGNEESLMKVLADQGVNYIRIRIWNDPKNASGQYYGGGNNDVAQDLKIAKEASQYGMKVLLDFHYSDFWADPAQQILPKSWQSDGQSKLEKNVYDFTTDTLKKFKDIGSNIGMVQIGNEITYGMMGQGLTRDSGGSYDAVWKNQNKVNKIGGYLRSASKAVRNSSPNSLIAIHLETPNYSKYDSIMAALNNQKVDYDVLGSSFYPFWSVSAGSNTIKTLNSIQKLVEEKYGKLFVILETSWVNSLKNGDSTPNSIGDGQNTSTNTNAYKVGPQGQVDELTDMYNSILQNKNGLGAFYWEPAWIPTVAGWRNGNADKENAEKFGTGWAASGAVGYFPDNKMYYNGQPAWGGSSWDNQALFDIEGHPLQSLKFYKNAGNDNKEQLTRLEFVNQDNDIVKTVFNKTEVGKEVNISYPAIDGYKISDDSRSYNTQATDDGIKTVQVKVVKDNPNNNNNNNKNNNNNNKNNNKNNNNKQDTQSIYRMYNRNAGQHHYTGSLFESQSLRKAGWSYEGIGWISPNKGANVYRVYNPNSGEHLYTSSAFEKNSIVKLGWKYEGVSWHSGGKIPVYRLFNPKATGQQESHHYTLSTYERNNLIRLGWKSDGVAWNALQASR
ncbi:glycosyl hydrolase 53 family protein [Lactococcus cremoris]|uniref:glycosyl hydrolase 53 family protein n=1 Tax=Lactococcus lactis subsp. cremoris TaxID=1359 RepID=UPI002871839C|nr:glycosyl hydrolase 53 family protein [Lactococcus cremoris]MDR9868718.1 glycosyl hydrolase 53 family protein [Lactococcus cremoris]